MARNKVTILSILADMVAFDDANRKKVSYDLFDNIRKAEKRIYKFFGKKVPHSD